MVGKEGGMVVENKCTRCPHSMDDHHARRFVQGGGSKTLYCAHCPCTLVRTHPWRQYRDNRKRGENQ